MAILYLVIFSSLAIIGYYFLADKLGFTQNLKWDSAKAAADFFMSDYDLGELQTTHVKQSCLCNDGQTALFYLEPHQAIGLVYSHGNQWVSYLLKRGSIQSCQADAQHLSLVLNDYALPEINLSFQNEDSRKQWQTSFLNL